MGPQMPVDRYWKSVFFVLHSLSQSYSVVTMNVECSNFKLSIETCFILESIYSALLMHSFFHSTNYKGLTVFLMCLHCGLLTNKLKNNSLPQKGILHFAPNHIIKPF